MGDFLMGGLEQIMAQGASPMPSPGGGGKGGPQASNMSGGLSFMLPQLGLGIGQESQSSGGLGMLPPAGGSNWNAGIGSQGGWSQAGAPDLVYQPGMTVPGVPQPIGAQQMTDMKKWVQDAQFPNPNTIGWKPTSMSPPTYDGDMMGPNAMGGYGIFGPGGDPNWRPGSDLQMQNAGGVSGGGQVATQMAKMLGALGLQQSPGMGQTDLGWAPQAYNPKGPTDRDAMYY